MGRLGSKLESGGDSINGAPCPEEWVSWSGPCQAGHIFGAGMLHLAAQDVSAGTCQGPFALVPTTTTPHSPPHPFPLLQHFIPSCKPLGLIAAVVLGEAVKAEHRGTIKPVERTILNLTTARVNVIITQKGTKHYQEEQDWSRTGSGRCRRLGQAGAASTKAGIWTEQEQVKTLN